MTVAGDNNPMAALLKRSTPATPVCTLSAFASRLIRAVLAPVVLPLKPQGSSTVNSGRLVMEGPFQISNESSRCSFWDRHVAYGFRKVRIRIL